MLGTVSSSRDTILSIKQTQLCLHEVESILGDRQESKRARKANNYMLGTVSSSRDTILSIKQTQLCLHEVESILGDRQESKRIIY